MKNLLDALATQLSSQQKFFLQKAWLTIAANPFNKTWVAYEPELLPPPFLMQQEGITVLEEWFRWAEEWSVLLRMFGGLKRDSRVLEIGCGLGRIAFALRYFLSPDGSYDGFDICANKIDFLNQRFHSSYSNFRFVLADIENTFYNPSGKFKSENYQFPYPDFSFDLIYAASVFTHTLPTVTEHYFQEAARVLKPGGRCVFSFFLLDYYQPGRLRPLGFARSDFNFDYSYLDYDESFAIADPANPEKMTAYQLSLIKSYAKQANLQLTQAPLPGIWSGNTSSSVNSQDILIFQSML